MLWVLEMAPSFDCSDSSLLCAEEDFPDNGDFESIFHHRNHHQTLINDLPFDGGNGLPVQTEECVCLMIEKEYQFMVSGDYLKNLQNGVYDLDARKNAIDWITKVHTHYAFGPLCLHLSANYLDRFISSYELPKGKAWMMQLVAVACLSLAAKMEETEVPLCIDLQMRVGDAKYVFESKTIERMELLILSNLKWKMQAITPYSFIDYALRKINGDYIPLKDLISRSVQLISRTINVIEFMEFKPSEVAAAVAVITGEEILTAEIDQAIYAITTNHVKRERLLTCIKLIHESCMATSPLPQSPTGVLDAASCLSYKSYNTTSTLCTDNEQNLKRRKLNGLYESKTEWSC